VRGVTIDPPTDQIARGGVRNQVLFREMNDQIRALAEDFGVDADCDLVCECVDGACFERVSMPIDDYAAIRSVSSRFIVKHGHAVDGERVVEATDRYDVVERISA
jgi:hypothetical protein